MNRPQDLRSIQHTFENLNETDCRRWMCNAENVQQVAQTCQTTDRNAKMLLSFLYMNRESHMIFEDVPLDQVLKRLVAGIARRMEENDPDIMGAVLRTNVMFEAWKRRDAGRVLQFLSESCISQARKGEEVDEEMLHYIESIGGTDALNDTRRRCDRFERVTADNLPQRISQIADNARWDIMKERVQQGDIEGTLFPLLRDIQQGIMALMGAAPRAASEFENRFDVDFMLERHRNHSLSREDVGNYASYLANMIANMQAPVDDREVRPWVAQVERNAQSDSPLLEYLPTLVDVVREGGVHLRRVLQRLEEFSASQEQ